MTTWEFDAGETTAARIRVPAGSVRVVATPTPKIRVTIEPPGRPGGDGAEDLAQVGYESGRLTITVPDDQRLLRRRSATFDVTVTLPPGATCEADTASADVVCTGELAALTVQTASGDVSAGPVTGLVDITSTSGDVRLEEPGSARVKTVSGDISIDPAGGDVDGQAVSGDVQISGVGAGRVAVKTTSGDITVAVVKGTGVQLDLSTLSGEARSELDHGGQATGAADATVICRSISGDVTVRRAA
jgi:DUF4097 and DUF4098 domain-containing protein YvlB